MQNGLGSSVIATEKLFSFMIVQVSRNIFWCTTNTLGKQLTHSCCLFGQGMQERMICQCTSTSAIAFWESNSAEVGHQRIPISHWCDFWLLSDLSVSHPKKVIRIFRNAAHFSGWHIQDMLPPDRAICCSFTCRWSFTVETQGICIAAPFFERLFKEQLNYVV